MVQPGTPVLRFDVFGRRLGVVREGGGWRAFFIGGDGTHRPAPSVVIPADLNADELVGFLSDLFHESARPDRADVVALNPEAVRGRGAGVDRRRAVFLIGASGVGKTAVATELAGRPRWRGGVHHFDRIGVPSPERMVEDHGSDEGWQKWATEQWIRRLADSDRSLQLLEGQTRPSFILPALVETPRLDPVLVLLDCSPEVRRHRLAELRGQPELVTARMESWADHLRREAESGGIAVIDTGDRSIVEVADRVEAIGLAGVDGC